ncbi:unnamed protein product [Cuscuta epithymum]|uniref:Uncharacterized protein n=1 Tax=Cuscuta epithymum TaxID=186058 RepID=A0AAV0CV42_9ASTE|nr:unnamed protein product [Cuscuta epithymum]
MATFKGLGSCGQNNKPGHVNQATSGSSSRSTPSPPTSSLGRNTTRFSTPSFSHSIPSNILGSNIAKKILQTKQPPQPPPSQYSLPRGPRPNMTPLDNQQPIISQPLNHQKQSPSLPDQHHSTSHIHDDIFEDNQDVEDEIIDWKLNAYGDLKWGEKPLDPFKSISVAKFQRPNVGVNATGELINVSINNTSLKFQGIVSKQIKYNLHPAGQQWKWVPERTKELYWEQFKDVVTWDTSKYELQDIQKAFERHLKSHTYSSTMLDIRKNRPPTVNDFTWAAVQEYKRSIQFIKASESGKKNRIAGGDKCKQYGGSRAATDWAAQELRLTGEHINPFKLRDTYHPKKRKNGELIDYSSQSKVMIVQHFS